MKLRTFAIGILWAALAALAPVATIILDDLHTGKRTDWDQARRVSVFNAAGGVVAYWRKHKALLKLPPDLAAAINDQATS